MSAIWGVINLKGNTISSRLVCSMQEAYKHCKIDAFWTNSVQNVGMGCGLQYFTKEAEEEVLPYFDEKNGVYFTADCLLDNREELMSKLDVVDRDVPDGVLIYNAYLRWGNSCVNYLLGTFAFVIYDKNKEEVIIFSDHVSSRVIYYTVQDGVVYFSSLIEGIKIALNGKITKNDRWIVDYLAMNNIVMISEPIETPYKNICKVEAGSYMVISKNNKTSIEYWNPTKMAKKRKNYSETEFKKEYLNLFNQIIKNQTRTNSEVGVLLSSGLDSSAVACMAAISLEKYKKKLFSFTSIPLKEFKNTNEDYYISDEASGVELICNHYKNIIPTFDRYEGRDTFSEVDYLYSLLEIPYKSTQNLVWLDDILDKARQGGCRIVLTGQYGNITISFGDIMLLLDYDLLKGKLKKFYKEFTTFSKKHNFSRKKFMKFYFKRVCSSVNILRSYKADFYENVYVNPKKAEQFKTKIRFKKQELNSQKIRLNEFHRMQKSMKNNVALSQMGESETKFGLTHGIIMRDPTRDKRMIEFCMSIPMELFVSNGLDRKLVRGYMQGIVPDEILNVVFQRGLQSADWLHRLGKRWDGIYEEIRSACIWEGISLYLDKEKVGDLLSRNVKITEQTNELDIRRLINIYVLSKYLMSNFY